MEYIFLLCNCKFRENEWSVALPDRTIRHHFLSSFCLHFIEWDRNLERYIFLSFYLILPLGLLRCSWRHKYIKAKLFLITCDFNRSYSHSSFIVIRTTFVFQKLIYLRNSFSTFIKRLLWYVLHVRKSLPLLLRDHPSYSLPTPSPTQKVS